jgi:hypothetical protein
MKALPRESALTYVAQMLASQVLDSIEFAGSRVSAAERIFTRVTDTENWDNVAIASLTAAQQHDLQAQLGSLQVRLHFI